MTRKKIAILGSGPSGLITAYFLSKKNYEVHVYEASATVGGLAQTIQVWGQNVELGPHFLNYDECRPLKSLVNELFDKEDILEYKRDTSIVTDDNRYFRYPPALKTLVGQLSAGQMIKAVLSYFMYGRNTSGIKQNAENLMIDKMGPYLYQLFFKNYSEKLWGVSCLELDACYFEALIPFKNGGSFLDIIKPGKPAGSYVYFKNGISDLWNRLYKKCLENKVTFHLTSEVTECETADADISVKSSTANEVMYNAVISTLPNSLNKQFFGLPKTVNFRFRNAILVYLKADRPFGLKEQCLYLYSKKIKAARLTNFSNFPKNNYNANVVLAEYWTNGTGLWEDDDVAIITTVKNDLKKLKIAGSFKDFQIVRIKNAYRIPEFGLPEKINREARELDFRNFYAIGRSNSPFFNYGMDSAITEAEEFCRTW